MDEEFGFPNQVRDKLCFYIKPGGAVPTALENDMPVT
jgi:hypothetical protein